MYLKQVNYLQATMPTESFDMLFVKFTSLLVEDCTSETSILVIQKYVCFTVTQA